MTKAAEAPTDSEPRRHVLTELGLHVGLVGDELQGTADISPLLHVPGTDCLRTSVLAVWTDTMTGMLAAGAVSPRVPVTLELAVDLYRLPVACEQVTVVARILKTGASAIVAEADFLGDGEPLAMGAASFMLTPDPAHSVPSLGELLAMHGAARTRLTVPLAERAECERRSPGVAMLGHADDKLNAANTINGGLIALTVEEAVLSTAPGSALSSLALRYVRPARVGPIVATTENRGSLDRTEVRDAGSDDRLVAVATSRTAALIE